MVELKKRVLKPNKTKWIFFLIIFLAFFSFSMFMIFVNPGIDGKVMGGGLSLLFSVGIFFLLYKTKIWKTTLELNQKGILINNLPLNESQYVGKLFQWKEIKSVSKFRQKMVLPRHLFAIKQDYIIIYLKSSNKDFLNNKENFFWNEGDEEIRQGNQIQIPNNFLPYFSIDKNLSIFKNYPIKIE